MPNISKIKLPNQTVYTIVDKAGRALIAGDFSTATAYNVGDYVIYNDKLYQFSSTHPAGAWDSEDVIETTTTDEIKALKNTISGGVHFVGTTTSPIYDGATTSPITINGSSYNQINGDLVLLDVTVSGIATEISYPQTLVKDHYYKVTSGMVVSYYIANDNYLNGADWDTIAPYLDFIGKVNSASSQTIGGVRLEFIWDGTRWNAFGSANAFGELAFKDKVSGTYTKPTGTGSGTVTKALGTVTKKFLTRSQVTGVAGTTTVSKMTAGTAVNVATVDTAVRYGTADVGAAVTYGTANKASSATTVGNANVGNAVAVATQGDTFYYGTADVDTAVTVATAGTPVVYGNADVGASVTYGNANVGTTTENVAIANGATAPYAVDGVIVSMDQTDSEMLVIATATTGIMTQVTGTTSIVQAASSNTTLTPAKAADTTRKLTPVGGTTSITPAKSAGQTHSAVGVGGTTNITPAVTSTTTIYGAVDSTSTLTPAVAAPNTQTLIPAKANGSITPWSNTDITVATAASSATSILTGDVQDTYGGGSPDFVYDVAATSETVSVSVGTTTDTLISR